MSLLNIAQTIPGCYLHIPGATLYTQKTTSYYQMDTTKMSRVYEGRLLYSKFISCHRKVSKFQSSFFSTMPNFSIDADNTQQLSTNDFASKYYAEDRGFSRAIILQRLIYRCFSLLGTHSKFVSLWSQRNVIMSNKWPKDHINDWNFAMKLLPYELVMKI